MTQVRDAAWYLYPRVCPILSVSRDDLMRSVEMFGRVESITALAQLIVENYEFPYECHRESRVSPPSSISLPRLEGKTTPASASLLLGGYRCSRLSSDQAISGITLMMHDAPSRDDWILDSFMEPHRMKCWTAVQGKPRRWADTRNDMRSPHAKATNVEPLVKLIETELATLHSSDPKSCRSKYRDGILNHDTLHDALTASSEAIPPNVELYLQTIAKLKPSSVSAPIIGYGVSLAALAVIASEQTPCFYKLSGLTPAAADSLRKFIESTNRDQATEMVEREAAEVEDADLVFLDVLPYGTHDLRAYLGEKTTPRHLTYSRHLRHAFISPLRQLISDATEFETEEPPPPTRIAVVVSLRELPALPSIEPMLLAVLSDLQFASHLTIVGALISYKRDYAVYLMLLHARPRLATKKTEEQRVSWETRLRDLYPELTDLLTTGDVTDDEESDGTLTEAGDASLRGRSTSISGGRGDAKETLRAKKLEKVEKRQQAVIAAPPMAWDTVCLRAAISSIKAAVIEELPNIALQGPRIIRGKSVFPSRTRKCVIISSTTDASSGAVVFVFGSSSEPPRLPTIPITVESPIDATASRDSTTTPQTISDPLLSRMVSGIRESMTADSTKSVK